MNTFQVSLVSDRPQRFWTLSLPRRLAIITALLALLLVAGSTDLALALSEQSRLEDLKAESVNLTVTLAAYLTRLAPTGDPTALSVGLDGWSRRHLTETAAVVFRSDKGRLQPAAASDSTISRLPAEVDSEALTQRVPLARYRSAQPKGWEVATALGGSHPYGVVHVQVTAGRLTEWAREERRRDLLLAMGSALLVACSVAVLTTRWVGVPLRSLTGAMEGAHGGAAGSPPAREVGPPEFRLLAQRYNALRGALIERERESEARAGLLALEERARGYDRLAQAEETAATFAHEIGTPLNTMNGHLQLLAEDLRRLGHENSDGRLSLLRRQLDRVAKIVRGRLSGKDWPRVEASPVELSGLVGRLLEFLQPTLTQSGIRASHAGSATAAGDPDQIEQILLNLLKNAIEAQPEGGEVSVVSGVSDGVAFVEVTDQGPGLSPETRFQLFQPLVTSKPLGSGLGLMVSRRLARALNGELSLLPSLRGTRWRLTLPTATTP